MPKECANPMPIMSRALVLCLEAVNTNSRGCTERHGPETEHVQFAASTCARQKAYACNIGQGQTIADDNLG